jgi:hypothetical protein
MCHVVLLGGWKRGALMSLAAYCMGLAQAAGEQGSGRLLQRLPACYVSGPLEVLQVRQGGRGPAFGAPLCHPATTGTTRPPGSAAPGEPPPSSVPCMLQVLRSPTSPFAVPQAEAPSTAAAASSQPAAQPEEEPASGPSPFVSAPAPPAAAAAPLGAAAPGSDPSTSGSGSSQLQDPLLAPFITFVGSHICSSQVALPDLRVRACLAGGDLGSRGPPAVLAMCQQGCSSTHTSQPLLCC